MYIGRILEARSFENAKYEKCLSDVGNKIKKIPVLMSQKKPLEENITKLCDDQDIDIESNDNEDETCLTSQRKNSFQDMKRSGQVNGSTSLDRLNWNEGVNISVKKRKSDAIDCTSSVSHKFPKRDSVGQGSLDNKIGNKVVHEHLADVALDASSMNAFISLWRDKCKLRTVPKVCGYYLFDSSQM